MSYAAIRLGRVDGVSQSVPCPLLCRSQLESSLSQALCFGDCFLDLIKGWHGIQCLVDWNLWETVNGLVVDGGWAVEYTVEVFSHLSRVLSLSEMREDPSALRRGDDPDGVGP